MNCYSFCRLPCCLTGSTLTPEAVFAFVGADGADTPPIAAVPAGVNIPLPRYQVFSWGILSNAASTEFTIQRSGVFRLAYQINTQYPVSSASQLAINHTQADASLLIPATPQRHYAAEVFLFLNHGDCVSLQLTHPSGETVLLQSGVGATLSIERIG